LVLQHQWQSRAGGGLLYLQESRLKVEARAGGIHLLRAGLYFYGQRERVTRQYGARRRREHEQHRACQGARRLGGGWRNAAESQQQEGEADGARKNRPPAPAARATHVATTRCHH